MGRGWGCGGKMLLLWLSLLKDEVKVGKGKRKGGRMKRNGRDKQKKMLAARETRRMKERKSE